MKYLIQNKKEFAITVAAFIMAVINLVKAIKTGDIDEELIIAVLVTGTTILAWYYNMPTSEENCRHTGLMRLEKQEVKGINGEAFFDEDDDYGEDEYWEDDGELADEVNEEGDE